MKIFLDNQRKAPKGWKLVKTSQEAINLLKKENVTEISLDHDLGEGNGNGYDVILWLEEMVCDKKIKHLPKIKIHTSNTGAYRKMYLGILKIRQLFEEK